MRCFVESKTPLGVWGSSTFAKGLVKETSATVRSVILGGQDGLVNVLGIVLAVAKATHDKRVILISGLAATFAESISMAAVAYTSAKAGNEYYHSRNKRNHQFHHPIRDALVLGFSALLGSLVPLIAFLFWNALTASLATLVISTVVLFIAGMLKGKYTGVSILRSGIELAVIGMLAAIAGYTIGTALGALPA